MMLVLHANWTDSALHLWAESPSAFRARNQSPISIDAAVIEPDSNEAGAEGEPSERHQAAATALADTNTQAAAGPHDHPFATDAAAVARELRALVGRRDDDWRADTMTLALPGWDHTPQPSSRLAAILGGNEDTETYRLAAFTVPTIAIPAADCLPVLAKLAEAPHDEAGYGHSLRYWLAVGRFVSDLLADQRFIPTLMQPQGQSVEAWWLPWLHDEAIRERVATLLGAMPPVVRAVIDEHDHQPWPMLENALRVILDATIRRMLDAHDFAEAIEDRTPAEDAHVAWLAGLLGDTRPVDDNVDGLLLLNDARKWIARLHDADDRPFRLGLTLHEPDPTDSESPGKARRRGQRPAESWRLAFSLVSEDGQLAFDAGDIWNDAAATSQTARPEMQELLLKELGRAARLYAPVEDALADSTPTGIDLTTAEAYTFLREYRDVLAESGMAVAVPDWWDDPSRRIGARLQIHSDDVDPEQAMAAQRAGETSAAGLNQLVQYHWQLAIGDRPLTIDEFKTLIQQDQPLVRFDGQWVEIRPEDARSVQRFLDEHPGGELRAAEALRLAFDMDAEHSGVPLLGLDATGWVARLFDGDDSDRRITMLKQPERFHGELRPYQQSGLSWLAFLESLGLGGCLADDMGLGKTIQLIALLLYERQGLDRGDENWPGPTLLIVPTSVVSNWTRELQRFAPTLVAHVHHGLDRPLGDGFREAARSSDVVVTTYALVSRDHATIHQLDWHRVVLDEAQYIKNPPTKQAQAIRALSATRRIALTGTPVENRLSELWSIMDFCNPGYLGPRNEFRRRFGVPIERHRNQAYAARLRRLVRPFILRRLKSDPEVIDDLPECMETKAFATLTAEQAELYQQVVGRLLDRVEDTDGMQRRGMVLATLVKLKQVCNHPVQLLRAAEGGRLAAAAESDAPPADVQPLANRSGKCRRLLDMLEEVLAEGDQALVFTQFRQMGQLLSTMIQEELDCNALFLHGGTPPAKRQELIDRFQAADGRHPVFILSLKAGGLGLNLTAANHVFHFDRWWNPAVEKQATDRAYRIGQHRSVHVHKFVCQGTLEERIDQMIEMKTELAENILGSGEEWLTELSTGQLRDLLTLRQSAMEIDS